MVAGLELDIRAHADPAAAVTAYLAGYRAATGRPLDERRLRAHVLRARLERLASRLRKGRLSTAEAAAAVADLRVG
jgi:hypothetical protein